MANEVVKYANELNKMPFNALNANQQNILFTLFTLIKESETNTLKKSLDEILELAQIDKRSNTLYIDELLDKLRDIQALVYRYQRDKKGSETKIWVQENIFPYLEIDEDDRTLEVKVSPNFKAMYLSAYKNFTRFYLAEFAEIPSTYTKTIYRFLRQWQTEGVWYINYDDFKELLEIPKSYRATNIDQQILNPTIEYLAEPRLFDPERIPFKNLQVIKHKDGGKSIKRLEFRFEPIKKSKEQQIKELKAHSKKIKTEQKSELKRANDYFVGKWLKLKNIENAKKEKKPITEPQRYGLIQKIFYDESEKQYGYTYAVYYKKPAQINSNFVQEITYHEQSLYSITSFLQSLLID